MSNQLIADGILAGSIYVLIAVGFALAYRVSHFFNFTHGFVFTLGAYQAYLIHALVDSPLLECIGALVVGTFAALLISEILSKPLLRRRASPLVSMLASLGIYVVGQNLVAIVFGDRSLTIHGPAVESGVDIFGARLTIVQLFIIGSSWLVAFAVMFSIWITRIGAQIRALDNDRALAEIVGIPVTKVAAFGVAIGGALAGLAGFFTALDLDMAPNMGMAALLIGIAAAIAGGRRRLALVSLAALSIGIAQSASIFFVPAAWQESIAFIVLLLALTFQSRANFLTAPRADA